MTVDWDLDGLQLLHASIFYLFIFFYKCMKLKFDMTLMYDQGGIIFCFFLFKVFGTAEIYYFMGLILKNIN